MSNKHYIDQYRQEHLNILDKLLREDAIAKEDYDARYKRINDMCDKMIEDYQAISLEQIDLNNKLITE